MAHRKHNAFDRADAYDRRDVIHTIVLVADRVCDKTLNLASAKRIARRLTAGKKTLRPIYHTRTAKLCAIVKAEAR